MLAHLYLFTVSLLKPSYLGECLGLCGAGLLQLYPAQLFGHLLQGLGALGMSVGYDRTMMITMPEWRAKNSAETGKEDEKLKNNIVASIHIVSFNVF